MDNQKEELIDKFALLNSINKNGLLAYMAAVYTSQLNTEQIIREQYGLDKEPPKDAA